MDKKMVKLNNLDLYTVTAMKRVGDSFFDQVSVGFYVDPNTKEHIICVIGFDLQGQCIGMTRLPGRRKDGSPILPLISYGTEYRDAIASERLKTEDEWKKQGYKLRKQAIGEYLYPTKDSDSKECYYGLQEVIRN